ncbi:MAG: hypothetical protein WA895_05520, partial [Streptosporangiaceae bacterium]
ASRRYCSWLASARHRWTPPAPAREEAAMHLDMPPPLLHPFGRLQCHDLFLTDIRQYRAGFFGPGKYDGSVVNWMNGPLLHRVGSRSGFDVQIASFAGRPSSNIKTLTAQVRE